VVRCANPHFRSGNHHFRSALKFAESKLQKTIRFTVIRQQLAERR
jgi:hypothetical protein